MNGKEYSDEIKAAAMAALLQGQSVNSVARQYKIPKGTVSGWKEQAFNHANGDVVSDLGMKGIQVGAALEDCSIHHNLVYRYGQAMVLSFRDGILNNPGSVCDIYDNLIQDGTGTGIYDQGDGGNSIYNNVIVRPGNGNAGIDGIDVGLGFGNTNKSIAVLNNTIITPTGFGVFFVSDKGTNNRVQNNIIINPGNLAASGVRAYVMIPTSNKTVLVSNNLNTPTISTVKFTNPASDDYTLQLGSPAIDAGANVGIATDYAGATRPQGAGFDIGAYEYTQVVTPTPTSMATPTATITPTPTGTPCSCPCACR